MAEQLTEPVGYKPQGWHFHKTFVDDEGNVFHKGVHAPNEKATLDWTSRQVAEDKTPATEKRDPNEQEDNGEILNPDSDETLPTLEDLNLSDDVIDKLKKMFTSETKAIEERMKALFMESLKETSSSGAPSSFSQGEQINVFAQAIAKAEQFQKGGSYYHDIKELDPSDYSEKGVTFTSYGNGYLIIDDVRKGHAVRTPYGRIFKFRFQASRITRVGKVDNYSSFCTFTTHSKKEIEWLRNHSRYNIEFYEDANVAINANAKKISIASRISKQVESFEADQIISRAKQYNIPIGGDLGDIKTTLTLMMAEEEMKKQNEMDLARNEEAFEQKFA